MNVRLSFTHHSLKTERVNIRPSSHRTTLTKSLQLNQKPSFSTSRSNTRTSFQPNTTTTTTKHEDLHHHHPPLHHRRPPGPHARHAPRHAQQTHRATDLPTLQSASPSRTSATPRPHASTSGATTGPTDPTTAPAAPATRPIPDPTAASSSNSACRGRRRKGGCSWSRVRCAIHFAISGSWVRMVARRFRLSRFVFERRASLGFGLMVRES